MKSSTAAWVIALAGAALLCASGCDAIVGARCRAGLVPVGGRCVAPSGDTNVDGGPALDAGDGGVTVDASDSGVTVDASDSGVTVDASDSGVSLDASDSGVSLDASDTGGGDGGGGDAGPRDSGLPGCPLGQISCGGVCVDGLYDPANCGGCGVRCAPGELCAGGVCTLRCDPPTMLCGGRCIDARRDPDNCGACGMACGSGICIDSMCSGPIAGHVVVVGHDYVVSRTGMNRVAGNAVFLARGNPVSVVVWEGGSTPASRAGTDAAIQQVATATGRAWTRIVPTDAARVPLLLAKADAFVIYAQSTGDDASLRSLGTQWARALAGFLGRGGVIVMFDTTTTSNSGTWEILDAARLFSCTGRTDTTGSVLSVVAPSDAVVLLAPLVYSGERTTVRFTTTATTVVVSDGTGPVVLHLTVVP